MTYFSEKTDEQLQELAKEGDAAAANELASRYRRLVKMCIRPYFLVGGDSEDLLQEGMIGLLSAMREYDASAGTSFKTYAELCIRRRVISAVKSAVRLKHAPLNDGVSFDEILSNENLSHSVYFAETFSRAPEEQVLARESENTFISSYARYLSDFENEILEHYLNGLSYSEISERCGRMEKSVDNAVQRIRKKLARNLKHGDFS